MEYTAAVIITLLLAVVIFQTYWLIRTRRVLNSSLLDSDHGPENQDYLQCMIDSLPMCVIGVSVDGHVTTWNLAAQQETGKSREDVINQPIHHAFPDLPITPQIVATAIRTKSPFTQEAIQSGKGYQARFTDLTLYPFSHSDFKGAIILAEDVTRRVRMELSMIQNEKMMSLGEMAAGLAHEINNPLAGILNNAQNIVRRTDPDLPANKKVAQELDISLEQIRVYLKERGITRFIESIQESGTRAANIITNMLEFSRSNNTLHELTDITELIQQSLELTFKSLELKTGFGIEMPDVRFEFAPNLPLVRCSRVEIQQVFMNLIRNAAQAFQSDEYGAPLHPQVTISVEHQDHELVIEIDDNGPGMTKEVKNHIFEPFFTTKDVGKGTGLGLSVSFFIITEHHKGTINVDSRPGEGTTFIINLPIDGNQAETTATPSPQLEINL